MIDGPDQLTLREEPADLHPSRRPARAPVGKRRQPQGIHCVKKTITISSELLAWIDRQAKRSKTSRSKLISNLINRQRAASGRADLLKT